MTLNSWKEEDGDRNGEGGLFPPYYPDPLDSVETRNKWTGGTKTTPIPERLAGSMLLRDPPATTCFHTHWETAILQKQIDEQGFPGRVSRHLSTMLLSPKRPSPAGAERGVAQLVTQLDFMLPLAASALSSQHLLWDWTP